MLHCIATYIAYTGRYQKINPGHNWVIDLRSLHQWVIPINTYDLQAINLEIQQSYHYSYRPCRKFS